MIIIIQENLYTLANQYCWQCMCD